MWSNIKNLFSKKIEEKVEEPEQIVEVVEEEIEEEPPPPLPDVIEVPWEVAKHTKNLDDKEKRIYEDLKDLLFQTSVKERAAYDMIDRIKELKKEKIDLIKEAYNIPDDQIYEYKSPIAPSKPGYLKKKETK